jgi:hypothetical protein
MADRPFPSHSSMVPPDLSMHGDAVLCYADICTTTTADGVHLATEARARALRKTRKPHSGQVLSLTWLPPLLRAVRATAAFWQARGEDGRLHSGLRTWLTTEAARTRPLALRAFEDMPEPDRSLLWYVEVEAQPVGAVAEVLGSDTAYAETEIARVRQVFRQHCLRAHADALDNETCRGYARLLDVATRTADSPSDPDLRQHLARCAICSEVAGCLALHEGRVPGALAKGFLGWGGLTYLDRRREAAAAYTSSSRPIRRLRTGPAAEGGVAWAKTAGIVAVLAGASLVAFLATPTRHASESDVAMPAFPTVGSTERTGRTGRTGGFETLAPVEVVSPSKSAESRSPVPPSHGGMVKPGGGRDRPVRPSTPSAPSRPAPIRTRPHGPLQGGRAVAGRFSRRRCRHLQRGPPGVAARLVLLRQGVHQPDVERQSYAVRPLGLRQAVDYNTYIAAEQPFTVGFVAGSYGPNPPPSAFALNGYRCTTAGTA